MWQEAFVVAQLAVAAVEVGHAVALGPVVFDEAKALVETQSVVASDQQRLASVSAET